MLEFFAELKRRHVYRVGAAYAVIGWVLLQLVNNVAPVLELPAWIARAVLFFLVLGFPIALILAWMFDATPEGLKRTAPAGAGTTKDGHHGLIDGVLAGALVLVIALIAYQQLAPSPSAGPASVASTATNSGGISIAVLPFVNLSDDRAQEFFSDGMTEEITSALAKIPNLQVVGRTSAFEFKGQNRDLRTIGQALGATHLIEGSVRKAGDRMRITAQLIRADNGLHLWTENYDRQLTDIFAIQEDIAQAIAGALRVPLGLQQGETLVRDRTKDLESYDQYLRARALYRDRKTVEAIAALEKLVARDPGFAPAWATLSNAYRRSPALGTPAIRTGPIEVARRLIQAADAKAEMAARRAIQLDPKNAAGYGALAALQIGNGKWLDAEDLFNQALALDANEPDVLSDYATLLIYFGRLKEALRVREKVQTLEPLVPVYQYNTTLAMSLNGQSAATIPILESLSRARSTGLGYALAYAYAAAGRYSDAADVILAINSTEFTRQSIEDAARLMRTAPTRAKAPEALPALEGPLAIVYAYVGAYERYLDQPERRFEARGAGFDQTIWLPELAPLRKTERFKAFARKAGIVDYWRARGWPDLCRPMGADDFTCD